MPKTGEKPVHKIIPITSQVIDMKINITPQEIHRGFSLVSLPNYRLTGDRGYDME
jgi:hypothetical protein